MLDFVYSQAHIDETIRTIDPESLENLPYGIDENHYRWVDLDGEGLAGILTEQAGTWFYKRNAGNGTFLPTQTLHTQPSLANLSGGRQQLLDFAGDGRISLAQFAGPVSGFYERGFEDGWEPFRTFPSLPAIDWADPNLRFIDLTGDGLVDVLITDQDVFTWYPSQRKWGFGAGEYTPASLNEEHGPALVFADSDQSIYQADMNGDGLSDLVRIRNGEVCYWPNIGYGRFGTKITLANAPWFDMADLFNQKRIRLADIDGSGTTDIIYLGREEVKLFFNQSGNRLSEPHVLSEFPRVDSLSSVNVVDLLGNGTACIVWSSPLPGDVRQPLYYIDLMGGQKPHLLISEKNNMGAETRIQYAASTKFYLADREHDTPWITQLPFPVYVVERVEIEDRVSNNHFVTRYAYHHGYYDGYEREFRGFGMVEQWDTEEINITLNGDTTYANLNAASFVPPVYTKSWFHNGAYLAEDMIARRFVHEYYKEDPQATLLPDTLLPRGLSDEEQGEACRSLKGSLLRQEVYAADGTNKSQHPYSVSEQNHAIMWMQPKGCNRHAVFFTHARESIDYHYERIYEPAHDPRVGHQIVLEVDDYGNVHKSIAIGYGRRRSPLAHKEDREKQTQTLVTYTDNRFTNPILFQDAYRTPLANESRTYELTGHGYSENQRPSLMQALKDVKQAAFLEYQELPDGSLQKRLIEHVRTFYRRDDLSAPLPLGTLESLALSYQSYKQAFTPGLLVQLYGDRLSKAMLEEGRYVHSEGDDNWWIPSGRVFYVSDPHASSAQELAFAREHFFLPQRVEDPFGNTTVVAYDHYDLLATLSRDALGNEVRAEYDYRVLQPNAVIDPSHNRAEAAFDTLGMLAGTAILGKVQDGQSESGDSLDGFVADLSDEHLLAFVRAPKEVALQLLGIATSRLIYDLDRFKNDGQPVFASTLARELHVNAPGRAQSPVQVSFTYSDGFGREIQNKIQAEPGDAPLRAANTANPEIPGTLILKDGKPVLAPANPRWVSKGRTVYNNKGKPIKQYEPFFSSTHLYEEETETVMTGVTPILFYDPVDCVIATVHPNHTYEKVVFDPWQQTTWDVNDTVLQTHPQKDLDVGDYFRRLPEADYLPTWYTQRVDGALGKQEQAAANKAATHTNTPALTYYDALGRSFLTIAENRFESDGEIVEETYSSRVNLDIENNQRNILDARKRLVTCSDYNMLSTCVHLASMEGGKHWWLNDATGKPFYAWDSRGHRYRTVYDALLRPTELHLHQDDRQEMLVGRTVYGEMQVDSTKRNLRTNVYQGFDSTGVSTNDIYDFKGNLLHSNRQLAVAYKDTLDWSGQVAMETQIFTSSVTYDAFNRPVRLTSPDNSVIRPIYNEATMLKYLEANLRSSADVTIFIENIDYNAKGQRKLIEYGNGVHTQYAYDPKTSRLMHLFTQRGPTFPDDCPQPHKLPCGIQNLHYAYDPVGNITSIRDDTQQTIYFRNRRVEPSAEYTYDAIYRLIKATGREHLGQASDNCYLVSVPTSQTDEPRVHLPQPGDGNAMGRYFEQYIYDAVGNILHLCHTGSHSANPGWTRSYTYHEPSQLEPDKMNNRLSSTHIGNEPPEPYTYDVHGNMTTMPHLPLMQWDYRDQLRATAQQTVNTGGTPEITHYVYDASGQRVRKVTERQISSEQMPARKAERIYLGSFEIYREYSGDGSTIALERETLHIMDDQQCIALIETRTQGRDESPEQLTRYQFGNHLGSAALELDNNAKIISYEEYYPFGSTSYQAVRNQTETPKRYRYTSKERDEETRLYYYGVRYYASWMGRWTSCDPIGTGDGVNVYAYVHGNPITLIDPLGMDAQSEATWQMLMNSPDPNVRAWAIPEDRNGSSSLPTPSLSGSSKIQPKSSSPPAAKAASKPTKAATKPKDTKADVDVHKLRDVAEALQPKLIYPKPITHALGGLQLIGGAIEAGFGGVVGVATAETVAGLLGGGFLLSQGLDNASSGWTTMTTGKESQTYTFMASAGLALSMGADTKLANAVGVLGSTAANIGSVALTLETPNVSMASLEKQAGTAINITRMSQDLAEMTTYRAEVLLDLTRKQRGAVVTGVTDSLTGEPFFGQNTGIPAKIVPLLEARISAYTSLVGDTPIYKLGVIGSHSEFNALNEA